jgi:hypothetical protein
MSRRAYVSYGEIARAIRDSRTSGDPRNVRDFLAGRFRRWREKNFMMDLSHATLGSHAETLRREYPFSRAAS